MSLHHFLIVYDNGKQRLRTSKQYDNVELALAAYSDAERANASDKNIEVVLIGSDSIDTVKRTHANYFTTKPPLEALKQFGT